MIIIDKFLLEDESYIRMPDRELKKNYSTHEDPSAPPITRSQNHVRSHGEEFAPHIPDPSVPPTTSIPDPTKHRSVPMGRMIFPGKQEPNIPDPSVPPTTSIPDQTVNKPSIDQQDYNRKQYGQYAAPAIQDPSVPLNTPPSTGNKIVQGLKTASSYAQQLLPGAAPVLGLSALAIGAIYGAYKLYQNSHKQTAAVLAKVPPGQKMAIASKLRKKAAGEAIQHLTAAKSKTKSSKDVAHINKAISKFSEKLK
jgi:hypothetical protein